MSRMVGRSRIAQAAAVLLGLVVVGLCVLTVVLDSVEHYPGTGGPLVDALAVGSAGLPAAAVATLPGVLIVYVGLVLLPRTCCRTSRQ